MSDFYKGLYEQQKESWEGLLQKYSKALSDGYKHESDFKTLDSSVRGMLRYHSEQYIKQKQFDPDGYLCRHYRDSIGTLAIILGLDYQSIWEELDGKKEPSSGQENDSIKSIG